MNNYKGLRMTVERQQKWMKIWGWNGEEAKREAGAQPNLNLAAPVGLDEAEFCFIFPLYPWKTKQKEQDDEKSDMQPHHCTLLIFKSIDKFWKLNWTLLSLAGHFITS